MVHSHLSADFWPTNQNKKSFFLRADLMQVLLAKITYLGLSEFNENLYLGSRCVCLTHI